VLQECHESCPHLRVGNVEAGEEQRPQEPAC
jgi:hypothetical protein